MKFLLLLLLSITSYSQVGKEDEIRVSIDPVVYFNESNYNIKIDFESGVYGDNRHRITIGVEILTGHEYYAVSMGYGYHIPYKLGNIHLSIQPSFSVGLTYRVINGDNFIANNHFWTLRHHISITDYFGIYGENRLIRRNDVQVQVSRELTYYFMDNSIGIYFKL